MRTVCRSFISFGSCENFPTLVSAGRRVATLENESFRPTNIVISSQHALSFSLFTWPRGEHSADLAAVHLAAC